MKKESTPFISIVIPAYNEERRLGVTIDEIKGFCEKKNWPYEIIVVDDGSKDNTLSVVKEKIKKLKDGSITAIEMSKNQGKGACVKKGVLNAKGEIISFMDADLPYSLDSLALMVDAIKNGFDIAIGGRDLKESKADISYGILRKISGRSYSILIQLLLFKGIPDTQCGFKTFRKDIAKRIFSIITIKGFGFDVELLFIAKKWNLKIKRVPVIFTHSHDSKVKLIRDSIKMFIDLFKIKNNNKNGLYEYSVIGSTLINCPLCDHNSSIPLFGIDGYRVVKCEKCSFCFLNPLPSLESIKSFYSDKYFDSSNELSKGYSQYRNMDEYRVVTFKKILSSIPWKTKKKRLLDLGCGEGYLMEAASSIFDHVEGIDISHEACEKVKEKGFVCHEGDLNDIAFPENSFDAVCISDVLEHIPFPKKMMKRVAQILKPKGELFIITPNIDSFVARLSGKRWISFKFPEHIAFYSPSTIRFLLNNTGFELIKIFPVGQYSDFYFLLPRIKKSWPKIGKIVEFLLRTFHLMNIKIYAPTGGMGVFARVKK